MRKRMRPERMQAAMEAYFARSDQTRERIPQKGGGFSERQIPYTLYGLSEAVELSAGEVLDAVRNREGDERTRRILHRGLNRVAAYIQERALLGELSAAVAQGALKELGLVEEREEELAPLKVVLDEQAEAYSR